MCFTKNAFQFKCSYELDIAKEVKWRLVRMEISLLPGDFLLCTFLKGSHNSMLNWRSFLLFEQNSPSWTIYFWFIKWLLRMYKSQSVLILVKFSDLFNHSYTKTHSCTHKYMLTGNINSTSCPESWWLSFLGKTSPLVSVYPLFLCLISAFEIIPFSLIQAFCSSI